MKAMYLRNLTSSIIVTVMLLYFMANTTSPKIVFIPFLISGVAMAGKSIAQLLRKKRLAEFFSRLFVLGFALFFFGFLVAACYISIRDKNYRILFVLLPMGLVGLSMIRSRIGRNRKKNTAGGVPFGIVVSAALVLLSMVAGVLLIVVGIKRADTMLIFAGAFFALGAFTFVLAALTINGTLDKFKIDVLGLYIGVLFAGVGIGFLALKYTESNSVSETIQSFGFWIMIPILMTVAGVIQILKCLRENKRNNIENITRQEEK